MKKHTKILVKYYLALLETILNFTVFILGMVVYFGNAPRWQQFAYLIIVGIGGLALGVYWIYDVVSTKEFQEYEKDALKKERANAPKRAKRWSKVLKIWGAVLPFHIAVAVYWTMKYGNSYVQNIVDIIRFIITIGAMESVLFFVIIVWWYNKNYRK